jgi:hypothetical protein
MKSISDITLSEVGQGTATSPGLAGPLTMKGTQTFDLEAA